MTTDADSRRGCKLLAESQNTSALGTAKRGQFVGAGAGWSECDFIVLSTPNGWLGLDDNLTLYDAGDTTLDGLCRFGTTIAVEQSEIVGCGGVTKKLYDANQ